MQQILIIAYFFPPCNLTASQRPYSWAKYLPEFGYDPIVITRNWDVNIGSNLDMSRDAGEDDRFEQKEGFKVWHMQNRGNLRDRFFVKYGYDRHKVFRKALTFIELTFQNFFISHLPYYNIYTKARELLQQNPGITKMIITANPFASFHFGYLLKNEFPQLKWVADYRDDWTTTELINSRSLIEGFVHRLEHESERKWVSNASCITSISGHYVAKISSHVSKPGHVILNGYSEDVEALNSTPVDASAFIINYTGSLYDTQPLELFLKAFRILKEKFAEKIKLKLQFPGLAYDKKQEQRVRKGVNGFERDVSITERMSRKEVLEWQSKANLMLMFGHTGLKGISSSKLYEYVGLRKRVLLAGNDHDIMEEILNSTGLGIICDTADEIVQALTKEIESFISNPQRQISCNEASVKSYSREYQTRHLAEILNRL